MCLDLKRDNRVGGPLRYDEILKEEKWWIAKVQKLISEEEREKRKDLDLQTNEDGLLETRMRQHYWVPKLRSLVKRVRSNCWGCT